MNFATLFGYDDCMKTSNDPSLPPLLPTHRRIGIIGGMGPAATVDLMQKIIDATPATRDQDHVPMVVWNVPQIPERVEHIHDATSPSPAPAMRAAAKALAEAGAEAIAIACNTAHFWAADVEDASGLPLLHIADAALAALAHRPSHATAQPRRILLLATTGTREAGIYSQRAAIAGVALELPDQPTQARISQAIAAVKAGRVEAARASLFPVLTEALAGGVDALLLACTELPIVVGGSKFEAQSVDATAALAEAIVEFSLAASTEAANDTSPRKPARPGTSNPSARTTQPRNHHLGDQVA